MLQFDIVFPSLPLAVEPSVEKKMFPPFVATVPVKEPKTEQFVIKLLVAPPIKRMVEVPDVLDVLLLDMVKELPPAFNPFMVTLSAPFRFIVELPPELKPAEIVRAAPPFG
jgi:hypothetical protein